MTVERREVFEKYIGLSSDTKPSVGIGSEFYETDTKKRYVYTATGWVEMPEAVQLTGSIPAGTNNIGDVDVLTLPADPHAVSSWTATAVSADNAAVSVTKAAESGKSHYITNISGSYNVAKIKLMTLKDDTTVISNFHVHNQRDIAFAKPVKITAGKAAELSLQAGGTAGDIGAVVMTGYTI